MEKRWIFFDPNDPPTTAKEIQRDTEDLLSTHRHAPRYVLKAMADWAGDLAGTLSMSRGPLDEIRFWDRLATYLKELSDYALELKHPMVYWPELGPGREDRYPYLVPHQTPRQIYNWTRIMLDASFHSFRKILETLRREAEVFYNAFLGRDIIHGPVFLTDPGHAMELRAESWGELVGKLDLLLKVPPFHEKTHLHKGPIVPSGRKEWRPE